MRNQQKNVKLLKHDIRNSIYHILGFHSNCSDFCTKKSESKTPEESEEGCDEQCEESFDDIFENQFNYWKLPSEEEFEQSRNACKTNMSQLVRKPGL